MGGAIRPDKSFVYPLAFKFKINRNYKYKSVADIDIELSVCNKFRERENLQLIEADKRKETLGVVIAPDSNIKDCLNYLKKKVGK